MVHDQALWLGMQSVETRLAGMLAVEVAVRSG